MFCFVLHRRSTVQFFVFVNFSNVHVCFVFRRRSAVRFFLYLPTLLMVFIPNVSMLASFFSCILVLALLLSVYYGFVSLSLYSGSRCN